MNRNFKFGIAVLFVAGLAGCVEESSAITTTSPSPETQACLRAISQTTNNPDVVLLSSSFSEAGTEVIAGVGPQQARWQCIGYRDGATTTPMSLTNEGSL
ncbi:hypothetical protein OU426_12020 [Frigidibacter sp. RF13]|uniref:hypothetical protein n=1 Tax=Frigidibacter sp. RF13 TaxID=2997340 RepID=UPI00226EE33D|nr:hypothetical protein [Frigidibacter sp. RF13]MCY1127583.1 hypothetical protein [Frigidibacter sp. RF13]